MNVVAQDVKLLADDFIFLEAPRWRGQELWVSDVFDLKVYALNASGQRRVVCQVPHRPSGLGFLPDDKPIVVSAIDRKLMQIVGESMEVYADLSGLASGPVNDFAVDDHGRIFVGNFGYDYDAGESPAPTELHRVDPDGSIHVAAHDLDFPNGSVVTHDGRTLIVAETWVGRLTAFDIDPVTGELSSRRVFADLAHRQPDGICVDAEGLIWVGCFNTGEFIRVEEGGKVRDVLTFEGRAVSCTLGGPDGKNLYCTVYQGTVDDISAKKRRGQLFVARVHVGA
jgi:sugar lactone lactonase YvrE